MFEWLPKPIFYKILDDINSQEFHKLSLVSKYFNKLINSEEFLRHQFERTKISILNQNPELNEIDVNLAASSLLGLTRYVQKFIDNRADVNVKLLFNKTLISPIHLAAYSGNLACVILLIKNKANFLPENDSLESDTPLHYAIAGGSLQCARYLLERGISVNHSTGHSWLGSYWTALEIAADARQPHCCELLIKWGANVHYKDPGDFQAIHRASESGSTECLRVLINHGADVNAYTEDGVTPLHIAIANGDSHCVRYLLALGANTKTLNYMFHNLLPLQITIVLDHFEIARILLDHDQSLINCAYTLYGRGFSMADKTPFQLAAAWGEDKWIRFFLSYNPDPDIMSLDGKTAIDYAKENGHEKCVELLSDYMIEREFTLSSVHL